MTIACAGVLLCLAACGGGGSDTGSAATTPAATSASTPAATSASAPAGTPDPATPDAATAGAIDAAALCAFLETDAPSLESVGSPIGALARFAGDYATWVEKDPSRKLTNSAELDRVTTAQCPQVRSRVLKALGGDSFAAVLG
jgi:hypothetical protein